MEGPGAQRKIEVGDVVEIIGGPLKWAIGCYLVVDHLSPLGELSGHVFKPFMAHMKPTRVQCQTKVEYVHWVGESFQKRKT